MELERKRTLISMMIIGTFLMIIPIKLTLSVLTFVTIVYLVYREGGEMIIEMIIDIVTSITICIV